MSVFTPNPVDRLSACEGKIHSGMSVDEVLKLMDDPTYVGTSDKCVQLAGHRKYDAVVKSKESLYLRYMPFGKHANNRFVWFQFNLEKDSSKDSLVLKAYGTKDL
ncbi:hypothetical protein GGI18_000658 [Coemansia linderi]|uniref:Uncharacterized protein n=1 Tax=Coemansia linderi TaxID=2663919 RepID=A0ACC1KM48_9FUNG|nr:hypothetical protein GGI18_000658 [Coemansia linderi]